MIFRFNEPLVTVDADIIVARRSTGATLSSYSRNIFSFYGEQHVLGVCLKQFVK